MKYFQMSDIVTPLPSPTIHVLPDSIVTASTLSDSGTCFLANRLLSDYGKKNVTPARNTRAMRATGETLL